MAPPTTVDRVWWRRNDEIWQGLTPGQVPRPGQDAKAVPVKPGPEYQGAVAVQFTPPAGVTPGLVGTVVDGKAHLHDVTATILDLAVRGWLTMEPQEGAGQDSAKRDWRLVRSLHRPTGDRLSPLEDELLHRILFFRRDAVMLSQLAQGDGQQLRDTQVGLYREVVARGWYPRHPRSRWRRVPRTADGTAVRIQSLGFKEYLRTAEGHQIKFEEAAGLFSRYLPYAIVFGVAREWADTFAEVVSRAEAAGVDIGLFEMVWISGELVELGAHLAFAAVDLAGVLPDIGEAVGGLTEGVSGFVESVDGIDVPDLGGCDLDLGGCDL